MTRPVALALTLAVALGWGIAAEAGGLRVGGGVGAVRERIQSHSLQRRTGISTWPPTPSTPCRDHGGRWTCVNPPAPMPGHPHRHHNTIIIVPQPIYVVPSRSCLVPGYWTYQWVPQTTWHTVYVPGYWAADGSWVESHYAQQPYTTGAYHPLWVPEQWAC